VKKKQLARKAKKKEMSIDSDGAPKQQALSFPSFLLHLVFCFFKESFFPVRNKFILRKKKENNSVEECVS
jgi:hypothetical protein